MTLKQTRPTFSTDNFALAVFLKANSCTLMHISKDNPRHAIFNFEENHEREKLTSDYWEGKALVEPKTYYSAQRELKTLLYDSSYTGNF